MGIDCAYISPRDCSFLMLVLVSVLVLVSLCMSFTYDLADGRAGYQNSSSNFPIPWQQLTTCSNLEGLPPSLFPSDALQVTWASGLESELGRVRVSMVRGGGS